MQDCQAPEFVGSTATTHLIHVHIYGDLGERYGVYLPVYGRTAGDCLAALNANFPDFGHYLHQSGAHYKAIDENGVEFDDQDFYRTITELHIQPAVSGSGGGFGKLLLGAALIGAAFIPGVNAIAIGATLSLQGILFSVGIGLALSGIGQLLAPKPKENETSYIFSDTKEPAKQGDPIPLAIGRTYFVLNSYLISGAIDTELVAVNGGGGKFGKG
jgi:predicted phage tail protein